MVLAAGCCGSAGRRRPQGRSAEPFRLHRRLDARLRPGGSNGLPRRRIEGVVDWARENAALNGLAERPIRWIVDDCSEFLQPRGPARPSLRPPSSWTRHHSAAERAARVWKIEIGHWRTPRPVPRRAGRRHAIMVHFSCHTPGFTASVLDNLLGERIDRAAWSRNPASYSCARTGTGAGRFLPAPLRAGADPDRGLRLTFPRTASGFPQNRAIPSQPPKIPFRGRMREIR